MRLGGPLFQKFEDPESWVAAVKDAGYGAAFCPIGPEADDDTVAAHVNAAEQAGIVIAEVGAWSNPISPDDGERKAAIDKCVQMLDLADHVGARCCVNIAGARGEKWDGPDADNFSADTFDLIVKTVQHIIDEVKPTRTYYALEMMPWVPPDSTESYLGLIDAIDRKQFGVHVDPVNIVNSPYRYYATGQMIRELFGKLGKHVRSCHAKDITIGQGLTLHLDETRPGLGNLDYAAYLRELSKLDPDTTLMLEHLPNEAEYRLAADHIRQVATEEGIDLT